MLNDCIFLKCHWTVTTNCSECNKFYTQKNNKCSIPTAFWLAVNISILVVCFSELACDIVEMQMRDILQLSINVNQLCTAAMVNDKLINNRCSLRKAPTAATHFVVCQQTVSYPVITLFHWNICLSETVVLQNASEDRRLWTLLHITNTSSAAFDWWSVKHQPC